MMVRHQLPSSMDLSNHAVQRGWRRRGEGSQRAVGSGELGYLPLQNKWAGQRRMSR
jgi:hypothetical protein